MLALFLFKSKILQVLRTPSWVVLRVLYRGTKEFCHVRFQMVLCNAVMITSGIFQLSQAQVLVFVLAAFAYICLACSSLVIVVELCTLLCYEVIVLQFR